MFTFWQPDDLKAPTNIVKNIFFYSF